MNLQINVNNVIKNHIVINNKNVIVNLLLFKMIMVYVFAKKINIFQKTVYIVKFVKIK